MQQRCNQCGNALTPGAEVCGYCGTPVYNNYPQQAAAPASQYGGSPGGYAAPTQYSPPPPPPPPQSSPQGTLRAGPYDQPGFGAPPQPGFGAPPAQPGYGAPPVQPPFAPPPQRKRSPAALIGLLLAAVVVLAGLGVGGYFIFRSSKTAGPVASPTPEALYRSALTSASSDWDCSQAQCAFKGDGYHVQAAEDSVYVTLLKKSLNDTVIEVTGTTVQDNSLATGMTIDFRTPANDSLAGYGFQVFTSSQGQGGYQVVRWDSQGNATKLINLTPSTFVHTGAGQSNALKVVVKGSTFTFFINGQQVGQTSDTTYPSGEMGLGASGKGADIAYTNLLITKP